MREDFLPTATEMANKRRLYVFVGTLVVALAFSLGYTWLRPPEYRASARLEITPATGSVITAPTTNPVPESARPFLTEVQVLTSRPLLELVAQSLERSGQNLSAFGPDPIAGMQSHLEAIPVANTNVVELIATGQRPELLAPLLNTIVDVYRDRLAEAYRGSSSGLMAQANDEVEKLEASVAAKRRSVEAFRVRHDIVSLDRGENQVLAQVRNLSTSLSTANERVATAEGKLRAINDSVAAGKVAARSRDNPTLADLEQRASQIRDDLQGLERGFTPEYLARDPKVTAMRARLAELENQIDIQRKASQQTALIEAQEELASARGAVSLLQGQIAAGRQDVQKFTARFSEYKSQQDELGELETAYRDAVQRRAKLDATEQARMPATKVLEAAATPQQPWQPLYWRDTAISVGGALVLALLAMWLVELLNRPEPQPPLVLVQRHAVGLPYEMGTPVFPRQQTSAESLAGTERALLPQQPSFPRELGQEETAALARASDGEARLVLLLLLSGITPDELVDLHWSDIDLSRGMIDIRGGAARAVALHEPLRGFLVARPRANASDLLLGAPDHPATLNSIGTQIMCAAHDAGIEGAMDVTPASLRHTYVAFLVRQGIRFSDLMQIVGPLPPETLGAYSALSPRGPRAPREAIDVVMPALRDPDVAASADVSPRPSGA